MKAKQIICLVLAVVMGLSVLVGCGIASASGSSSGASSSSATSTFNYSEGLTDEGFFKDIVETDYLTLPEYKGIEIPAATSIASDEDIQSQLDTIIKNYTTTEQNKEREVVDGDTLNIDYVGKVDGVEFDGGSTNGSGTTVTIGTTNYIDGFLDQLVGHKPGETFDINVTFPEDYGKEELNGKDAVFTITINYVQDSIVPELTDEFVSTTFKDQYGFETVEDLKKDVAARLISNQELQYLWSVLDERTTYKEMPAEVTALEQQLSLQSYTSYAAQYGVDLNTLLSVYGYDSTDAFLEANADQIKQDSQDLLLLLAIAKAEGMQVEEADRVDYFGTEDYSTYTTQFGLPFINMSILQNKAQSFLMESAIRA